jgi:hypothetical protein
MADSEDQRVYLETGIRACQTTPLICPAGNVVGMFSTHWRTPHQPTEPNLKEFDILAGQPTCLNVSIQGKGYRELSEIR